MPIFKRGKHWHFTKTIDGVRYRQALKTARTKTQAEEAERDLLSKIHEATYGRPSGSAVFIDFAEKVYLPWSRENKRSTNDQYHIKTFKAFFKRKTFSEISPMTIEKFKSERRKTPTKFDKPRSAASVNRELECLSSIFSMAMRRPHKLISENPCREVEKLREENRRFRYLSAEEEKRMLAACTDDRAHLKNIILVAINTGMRRGEILSLRWSQIDLARGLIHLVRTKSGKSRLVPINSLVREVLLDLSSERRSDFVFTSEKTGRALTHCKHAFAYACREAGITDLRFHDLRHTAATRLMEMGADPSTIKEILGHSDLRMTDRYTHAVEARKREALERISGYGEKQNAEVVQIKERRKS